MLTLIIYQKNHKRRPLRLGAAPLFMDTQADYPAGWCANCGSEVFESGRSVCSRCRKTKGEKEP